MPASVMEGESVLAVDIGGANTRAVLFDVVEGEYRFVAFGSAPSTAEAPFRDVAEGVRNAIGDLQTVVGRQILDADRKVIRPSQPDGSGVDAFVSTISAGPALKTAVVGLLADVSLDSARRLAETSYTRIVDQAGINDSRQADQQIDALLRTQPDIVVIAGGTDGGASRSVQKMLEPIGLSGYLLAPEKRPAVLFAGNQKLADDVRSQLEEVTSALLFSANVRPSLDTEDLEPGSRQLAQLFIEVRKNQVQGVDLIDEWSGGLLMPTAYAEGRMLRFLSKVYGGIRGGVLAIDIGASAAVIAAGFGEKSTLRVYPQFGLGENLPGLLQHSTLEEVLRWSPLDVSPGVLRDFIFQKALYPSSISATREDQSLSQAVTRQALYMAMQLARRDFPRSAPGPRQGLLPFFEPIIASGGALADAPTPGQGVLLLLDAIQPVGISTIILDKSNLLPLLGAAAAHNSMLPVQVLESGAFQSLGTVVSVVGSATEGSLVARARLTHENGTEAMAEIKYGAIEILPLPTGQTARLAIQPRHGANVGFGPGKGGTITVSGGTMGVVFDGRGRPLVLPQDPGRRRELIRKWLWTVGD
jgi:hypothetical protein